MSEWSEKNEYKNCSSTEDIIFSLQIQKNYKMKKEILLLFYSFFMVWYLLKLAYLLCFSLIVIFTYYNGNFAFHKENFDGYTSYILVMIVFYSIYKAISYISAEKKVIFTPLKLFSYFLLHLFTLCILFFTFNGNPGALGLTLFFKIISFLFIPIIIVLGSISFWKFVLSKISWFQNETSIFQFLFSLWIWFFAFTTFLTLFWFAGFYNLYSVFGILIFFIAISYKEFLSLIISLYVYKIEIENHNLNEWSSIFEKINLYLLSSEFLFIVITFLLSVNFISILRPMPIGWDDLWAYMNFPNLMAASGQILPLWTIPWQTFTGIWYMFGSATQSFFMNNVWWILSVLIIILSITDLLRSKLKTFLNIPLLAGVIFVSMPMVVFQQAKDMKLDMGLFFVSVIVIYLTIYIFIKYLGYSDKIQQNWFEIIEETNSNSHTIELNSQKKIWNVFLSYFSKYTHIWENDIFSNKSYLIYLLLIWILAWFAFSIKMTSLLLISGILGIIFYSKLWMAWFLAYLSFYMWIFTKAWLWDMMFVVYPKDDMDFRNKFFIYSILIWVILLTYSINKYNLKSFKNLIILTLLFILWVWIWFSPWWIRNIISLEGKVTIWWLLNGQGESFPIDYTKIYTQSEIDRINKKTDNSLTINASGTTTNEDMGRYFWYEKWINNYIKLPYNLTMQSNQRWEFTDITFIYLALIPVIVLFLAFKFEVLSLWLFAMSLVPLWFFFHTGINIKLTEFFTKFELPFWYLILALFFLTPFLYIMYSLNREKHCMIFKLNLVFTLCYIFLWTISAFWIVWYGVAMYYNLILMIAVWSYYMSSYEDRDDEKNQIIKFFGSMVVFFIIGIYILNSALPHGFSNIKTSAYESYKSNQTDNYISIFESHSDYYDALTELNIKKEKKADLVNYIISQIKNEKLKNIMIQNNITDLLRLNGALKELANTKNENGNLEILQMKQEVIRLRSELYKNILYPTPEYKNQVWIYRIGTFLKYFIADNHKRLLDDSMVMEFGKYFYDETNVDLWVERMKKMGVDFFLVDLNAATIDRDPRHDLTARYETLLRTFTSDKLELIQTDSTCLKIGLENYNKSQKTLQDMVTYVRFAGVNYEGYTASWETINRWVKQFECYNYILDLIKNKKINEKDYNYLLPISQYLEQNKLSSQEELLNFFRNYVSFGWMTLFRIK